MKRGFVEAFPLPYGGAIKKRARRARARAPRAFVPTLAKAVAISRSRAVKAARLGVEWKFLDCAWNGVAINSSTDGAGGEMPPSSGCTAALSVPAQGDGETNRDGRKYVIKSAWVSGVVDTTAFENQTDMVDLPGFYFALVLDTQTNAAAAGPDSELIFINPTTGATGMLPQPLRNLQFSKRFQVLASQYIPPGGAYAGTDGTGTNSLNQQIMPIVNLSWKGNIVCECTGITAASASASDNALFLIAYSTNGGTNVFRGKSRVRFVG